MEYEAGGSIVKPVKPQPQDQLLVIFATMVYKSPCSTPHVHTLQLMVPTHHCGQLLPFTLFNKAIQLATIFFFLVWSLCLAQFLLVFFVFSQLHCFVDYGTRVQQLSSSQAESGLIM